MNGMCRLARRTRTHAAQDLDSTDLGHRCWLDGQCAESFGASLAAGGCSECVDRQRRRAAHGRGWHRGPFTPDTVINIGSITKTITGVALMQVVQEGKLALDEDINVYLPFKVSNPNHPNDKITLRQIATHTSSIADRWAVYRETYHFGSNPEPLEDFLKAYFVAGGAYYATDNFLKASPGKQREYSNIAAGLAGYIVERVTGESLKAYTKRRIFTPLQMSNAGWSMADVDPARHAKLYIAHEGWAIPISHYELTTYPDGAVRTSVADLSKFFAALLNGGVYDGTRILDQRMVDEMLRLQFTDSNKPANVNPQKLNSGLFWATKYGATRIGHNGSDPGIRTEMLANLSKDIAVIMFTNTSLPEQEERRYGAIHEELWKYAEALKRGGQAAE
jgi:CubicO group peptidase (beta-lactamase class C family)